MRRGDEPAAGKFKYSFSPLNASTAYVVQSSVHSLSFAGRRWKRRSKGQWHKAGRSLHVHLLQPRDGGWIPRVCGTKNGCVGSSFSLIRFFLNFCFCSLFSLGENQLLKFDEIKVEQCHLFVESEWARQSIKGVCYRKLGRLNIDYISSLMI